MNQYRHLPIGFTWLLASAIALASAGAFAADTGKVGSAGRFVNEVQGRASAASPSVGARSVNTTNGPAVSEVYGRGNKMSAASGAPIGVGSLDVATPVASDRMQGWAIRSRGDPCRRRRQPGAKRGAH